GGLDAGARCVEYAPNTAGFWFQARQPGVLSLSLLRHRSPRLLRLGSFPTAPAKRSRFRWCTIGNPPHARWHKRSDSNARVANRSHRAELRRRVHRWVRSRVPHSNTTRSAPETFERIAPAGFGLGSGSNTTRPPALRAGSDAGRFGGQLCARRHNPDIDTWSFRPRLSHSFSYCHHRQNIAADCKHPSHTKPEKLGEPLSCGSIAADQSPARHTFLPIAPNSRVLTSAPCSPLWLELVTIQSDAETWLVRRSNPLG